MVEGVDNDSLYLTTDNGLLEKAYGKYRITPESPPSATIFVHRISNNDTILISQKRFNVKTFEGYTHANIAGKSRGSIKKNLLLAHNRVSSEVVNAGFDLGLPVMGYRVFILRENKVIFTQQNDSATFSKETKEGFESGQPGDTIYIVDIKAINPGEQGLIINVNDIILTLE